VRRTPDVGQQWLASKEENDPRAVLIQITHAPAGAAVHIGGRVLVATVGGTNDEPRLLRERRILCSALLEGRKWRLYRCLHAGPLGSVCSSCRKEWGK
jgi:hypothetical protein